MHLDVSEGDLAAVVLKKDIALTQLAKAGPDLELALPDPFPELGREAGVFQDLPAIQPVLNAGAV
jgi:hypothetical protein